MMDSPVLKGVPLLLILAGVGCDSNDKATTPALVWETCEENSAVQCSSLDVPMIHSEPGSKTITLALSRIPATSSAPLGSLVFNPGGPGGSGLELIDNLQQENIIPDSVRAAYHLVSFDPRGIGNSSPITCTDSNDEFNDYPESLAALQVLEASLVAYASSCSEEIGDYLLHTGSRAVVRDMELIRKALQEPTLNFLGYSYGTRLGGLYAQDYPERVGRFILDGSLPPTHDTATLFGASLPVMEANLVQLAESCSQISSCDPAQYKQKLESRLQTLLDTDAAFELEIFSSLVIAAVQSPEFIPAIAESLYDYSQDWNAGFLLQITDDLGLYEDDDTDSIVMTYAVLCADDPKRPTATEVEELRSHYNDVSDVFAELQLASALTCAGWPDAVDPLPEINTGQAPESLVIGGPSDTQTILVWSEQMAAAIGGRYLRSEHMGHTVVFSGKNQCTDNAAIEFLLNGVLPESAACPAN